MLMTEMSYEDLVTLECCLRRLYPYVVWDGNGAQNIIPRDTSPAPVVHTLVELRSKLRGSEEHSRPASQLP